MGHLLEVKDVTKIYEGGVLANHNVNFTCLLYTSDAADE